MIIKEGVIMQGLQFDMKLVLQQANIVWKNHGQELVITSALDGTHSASSYHYFGYALDLRTRYFTITERESVAKDLRVLLGKAYTVLLESTHIHVQFNA